MSPWWLAVGRSVRQARGNLARPLTSLYGMIVTAQPRPRCPAGEVSRKTKDSLLQRDVADRRRTAFFRRLLLQCNIGERRLGGGPIFQFRGRCRAGRRPERPPDPWYSAAPPAPFPFLAMHRHGWLRPP